MTILIHYSCNTYHAQIRSSPVNGFKQLYKASCTAGDRAAAQYVVAKHFGEPAARTVRLAEPSEIQSLAGDFFQSGRCRRNYVVWTFQPHARVAC